MSTSVLIAYYSRHGATAKMASLIARGINQVADCEPVIRAIADLDSNRAQQSEHPIITLDDLSDCDALALGSPSYYGAPAAPVKALIDSTTSLWLNNKLQGKPASVFTSSSSMHGGQEMCLMGLMVPLMHHGMLIMGLPYSEPALNQTNTGGTPYGPSHFDGATSRELDEHEKQLCISMGRRLAQTAKKLQY